MKKPIRVVLSFDIKLIKKCFAMLDIDIPSDEEIEKRFFERDLITTDLGFLGDPEAEIALCMAMIGVVVEAEEKEKS